MSIESLIEYVNLFNKGKETVNERRKLLIEQREKLIKKQDEIKSTIERLNYKIKIYDEISEGKRKDFLDQIDEP